MKRGMILCCLIFLVGGGSSDRAQTGTGAEPSLGDVARKTREELAKRKASKAYTNDNLPRDGGALFTDPAFSVVVPVAALARVGSEQESRDQFFYLRSAPVATVQNNPAPVAHPVVAALKTRTPVAHPAAAVRKMIQSISKRTTSTSSVERRLATW